MLEKRTAVAVRGKDDELWWFRKDDAKATWQRPADDTLYQVPGQWVLHRGKTKILNQPACLVDDHKAFGWLIRAGYEPPDELRE